MSSPNAAAASRRAEASAAGRSVDPSTTRIPLPPPPAEGLTNTGYPTSVAAEINWASERPGFAMPGTTGTPDAETVVLAAILSPIVVIAPAGGPMNAMPAAASAAAKSAFSERKP